MHSSKRARQVAGVRTVIGVVSWTMPVAAGRSGAVEHRGPVRRYLEVEPIIRGIFADESDSGDLAQDARGDGVTGIDIDPELLAIETRGLHKSFGRNHILRGLDLGIPEGCISVVLGSSGTGKSVLLQHIIGVMQPDAGDVLIRGRGLKQMSRGDVLGLRRGIGVMFQAGAR